MNVAVSQSGVLPVPDRVRERLVALGVCIVSLSEGRRVELTPATGECWLERLIALSRPFAAALQQASEELIAAPAQVRELWPGLFLVPLAARRRRVAGRRQSEPLVAAMILGHQVLHSDQFRLVCDSQQIDFAAAVRKAQPAPLRTDDECARLASAVAWMHEDSVEIDRRLNELESMSRQLGESYEELSLLYKLSSSMTVGSLGGDNTPEFLTSACAELCTVVGLKWMALKLIDDDPRLQGMAGQVFSTGAIHCDSAALNRIALVLLEQAARRRSDGSPVIVDDAASLNIPGLAEITRDLLVIELSREGRVIGLLFGGNKLDGSEISSVDSKLCSALANSLAIFLENSMLYEDMHAMFLGTLHALTSSIDAKDSYTHGHSERVALMSRMLAEAAGLDDHRVERVYISALIHDVGKIGVPEAVLCKPGQLTNEEFEMIKKHPEIGARILADIRQMQDLIPGVLYHHERWDGRGYPHRLKGADIPLYGRLISLADSFDAMSSNRTYRKALALEQVLSEVQRCAGTQFDPDLAAIFVKLDFGPFFQLLKQHSSQVNKDATK